MTLDYEIKRNADFKIGNLFSLIDNLKFRSINLKKVLEVNNISLPISVYNELNLLDSVIRDLEEFKKYNTDKSEKAEIEKATNSRERAYFCVKDLKFVIAQIEKAMYEEGGYTDFDFLEHSLKNKLNELNSNLKNNYTPKYKSQNDSIDKY